MDLSQFNDAERKQVEHLMEQKQVKDFVRLYSNVVERCFSACVNDFTSKSLQSKEEACVNKCTEKFLKHWERVGSRFAEQSQEAMEQLNQPPSSS